MDEDYDQEQEDSGSYDEEDDSGDDLGNVQMREVDTKNILNYQSDSDDEEMGEDSDDDLGMGLQK